MKPMMILVFQSINIFKWDREGDYENNIELAEEYIES
jgi:hypothetical protein